MTNNTGRNVQLQVFLIIVFLVQ